MSRRSDERLKLAASFLNTLGAAMMTAGVIAPLVALIYGLTGTPTSEVSFIAGLVIWFFGGLILHLLAWRVLGGLDDDAG